MHVQDSFVNVVTYFSGDPENQILILEAAPLSLSRELHIQPSSVQALAVPLELALFGVVVLSGAASASGGGDSTLFTPLLILKSGVRCSSATSWGG